VQSGGSAPTFNAGQVAQQQTQSNVNTGVANALLGNTNQITPYGNLTYNQTGSTNVGGNEVPTFTATQTLSPEQQAIYNKTTGLQSGALDTAKNVLGQVNNTVNTPLSFDGAPALPGSQDELRQQGYDASIARSRQELDRSREGQQVQLQNQGIAQGSEAWKRAMEGQDQALVDASNQATLNAGNIAGQNLSQAQALRNQSINETQTLRNQPLQDYQALLGLGGGVQQPTYATPTQASIQATDVTTPYMQQFQGQTNAYNQQQGANNAMTGALFGLGGSVLGGLSRQKGFGFGG